MYFKFVTDSPYGAETPAVVILDLLAETFDMHIYGTGIADVFVTPDLIQQLFSGEDLIWRRCEEIKKF